MYITDIIKNFRKNKRKAEEETVVTQKPRFLGPLKGTNKIAEGQRAHFEVRVEPQNDVTMKVILLYFAFHYIKYCIYILLYMFIIFNRLNGILMEKFL